MICTFILLTHDPKYVLAYDAAANFIFGPYAILNFPLTDYEQIEPPRTPPNWLIAHCLEVWSNNEAARPPSLAFERYILRNQKPDTYVRHSSLFFEDNVIHESFRKHIVMSDQLAQGAAGEERLNRKRKT